MASIIRHAMTAPTKTPVHHRPLELVGQSSGIEREAGEGDGSTPDASGGRLGAGSEVGSSVLVCIVGNAFPSTQTALDGGVAASGRHICSYKVRLVATHKSRLNGAYGP